MAETPAAIMREAYVEEVAKYAHIPRKVMDMEQVMEAGFRAALRALAAEFQDPVVKNAILWAASEGENQV